MDNGMYADIRSLICRDNDLLLIFHKFELLAVELVFFLSTTETSVNFYKTTPPSITEDHLFTRRRENLNYHTILFHLRNKVLQQENEI